MPKSDRDLVEALFNIHEPRIRSAFLEAVAQIRGSIVLRVVVDRLERGDISGAIAAMHLEADAFARLEMAFRAAYDAGGSATVANLPRVTDQDGDRVLFQFGVRNPEAEAWVRQHSGTMVTRTTADALEAVRVALTDGLARGDNPRRTALDVIGRVDRVTGRRVGGILGLTAPQERFVAKAREQLLSGDPAQLRAYLGRGRRDKRFDRTVVKAIREGKPIPREMVDRIVGRYSDRLLDLRGETVAMNETMTALNKSREDAIRQQVAAGKIAAQDVTKVWLHTPQEHPRLHHQAMNGKSVDLDGFFVLPNGAIMDYPHAPGAPAAEILFCKCLVRYKIDHFASVERRFKAEAA